MNKPKTFEDLLQLQKILDEEVGKPRDNGFVPRERTKVDILLSLDDEFQEWLRELPQKYNFKTWKEKTYNREKELEEFTDCLFFFLQYLNNREKIYYTKIIKEIKETFVAVFDSDYLYVAQSLQSEIEDFKTNLWQFSIGCCLRNWKNICVLRGFTKQEILDTYWSKWQTNMTRIKGDWTLKKYRTLDEHLKEVLK